MTSVQVSAQGQTYVFPPGAEVGIGIAETADAVLRPPGVSGHHARLAAAGGTWFLFDYNSAGATWAGGRRITSLAPTGSLTVRPGDGGGGADISLELGITPPPGSSPPSSASTRN